MFGSILLICGLFLVFELINYFRSYTEKADKYQLWKMFGLLLMVFWLLYKANSSTSIKTRECKKEIIRLKVYAPI